MPEDEFEIYLTLLAKTLRLSDQQRDAVAAELRDHMEARLGELTQIGHDREEAIRLALDEFGDASALANNLTLTNPIRTRHRRHLMQTTIGTVLTCAAVTFAVMLLTPTNKDGQPNQRGAVAQDDAFGGGGDFDGGGGLENDDFGDGFGGGFDAPAPRINLSIHVVDCTDILQADQDRGNLMDRTASLAKAVEQTIAAVNENGNRAIRVQPFEEFLIFTATDEAYKEARQLLDQIRDHVQNRSDIRNRQAEQRAQEEQEQRDKRIEFEIQIKDARAQINQARIRFQTLSSELLDLRKRLGPEHEEVKATQIKLEAIKDELRALEEHNKLLELKYRKLR